MTTDQLILHDMRSIPLLACCGRAASAALPFDAVQVASWDDALASYDEAWSAQKDRRYQDISLLLSQLDRHAFNSTWSKTVAGAKIAITVALQDRLGEHQVSEKVVKYIKSDLLGVLMEHTYFATNDGVPSFYRSLYVVYRVGHFPCGWAGGEFPAGHLLYY